MCDTALEITTSQPLQELFLSFLSLNII